MNIQLIHPATFTAPWNKILEGVDTLSKFESRIKKFCDTDTEYLSEDEQGKKIRHFLGDTFEVFGEMLIKTHPFDRRIGVSHYKPCHPQFGNEDYGVDGHGIGTNNRPATVQLKFRGDPRIYLTSNKDHLGNFKGNSQEKFGVKFEDTENMLVITNCKGIDRITMDKILNNKVRELNRDHLRQLVDDNVPFWDEFRRATTKS